jgi:hypothetical protein
MVPYIQLASICSSGRIGNIQLLLRLYYCMRTVLRVIVLSSCPTSSRHNSVSTVLVSGLFFLSVRPFEDGRQLTVFTWL